MAYRRDRKGRRTTRLLVATTLSVSPAIHGCVAQQPDDDRPIDIDYSNPKGSFYDEGLLDEGQPDGGGFDLDLPEDAVIFSNPKGCFFDEGLIEPDAAPDGEVDGGDEGVDEGADGSADEGPDEGQDAGVGGAGGGGG